jgi:hypothetical protein
MEPEATQLDKVANDDKSEKQGKKQAFDYVKAYRWVKGQSGNPNGRPKGKTLKEFAKEYLMSLPDDDKVRFLASLPEEIVWKMAEGNPETKSDVKLEVKELPKVLNIIRPEELSKIE